MRNETLVLLFDSEVNKEVSFKKDQYFQFINNVLYINTLRVPKTLSEKITQWIDSNPKKFKKL